VTRVVAMLMIMLVWVGGAAHAETPETTLPDTTLPDTAPADTAPAETAPPAIIAPEDEVGFVDSDGDDGIGATTTLLIVVVAVAAIAALLALLGRRTPPAATPVSDTAQMSLLSTSQWVHDQLSLELLAAAPTIALQRWGVERTRLDNIAIGALAEWSQGHGEMWQHLSHSVSALGAALDTNLQCRNQDPPDTPLIRESTEVVTRRRDELQELLTVMWPHVRG
jgi:hypothetical protein